MRVYIWIPGLRSPFPHSDGTIRWTVWYAGAAKFMFGMIPLMNRSQRWPNCFSPARYHNNVDSVYRNSWGGEINFLRYSQNSRNNMFLLFSFCCTTAEIRLGRKSSCPSSFVHIRGVSKKFVPNFLTDTSVEARKKIFFSV